MRFKKFLVILVSTIFLMNFFVACGNDNPPASVNKRLLQSYITAAAQYEDKQTSYTETTFTAFTTALSEARSVNSNTSATQAQVDSAANKLKAAIEGLTELDDNEEKAALRALITNALEKVEADYTSETWTAFAAKLTAARAVSEDADATVEQINTALGQLQTAISGLVFKEVTTGFGSNPVEPAITLDMTGTQSQYIQAAGKYGVEGAATLKYIIGEDGLYFYGEVRDSTLCTANATLESKMYDSATDMSNYMEDSDRVEIFLDTLGDGGTAPKSDDIRVRINVDGFIDVYTGNGARWVPISDYTPDYLMFAYLGDYAITQRDPLATTTLPSELIKDDGYKFEVFFSYSRHNFAKRDLYYISYGQADYMGATAAQIYNGVGNVNNPDEFFYLSQYGLGVKGLLEIDMNSLDLDDAFWSDAHSFTTTRPYAGTGADMTAVSKVKFGADGLYIGIKTTQSKLVYGGPNNGVTGFGYKNDHVELRLDTNSSQASDAEDRFYFIDIGNNRIMMKGITTDTRSEGFFNYSVSMQYYGEVVDGYDIPFWNIGSTETKGFIFKIFLSYEALGITKAQAQTTGVGVFAAAGNPTMSGIGCVIGDETNRADTTDACYMRYANYLNVKAA